MSDLEYLNSHFVEDVLAADPQVEAENSPINQLADAPATEEFDEELYSAFAAEIQDHMDVVEDAEYRREELGIIHENALRQRAVDYEMAQSIESLVPGSIVSRVSLNSYSRSPSMTNYQFTMEEALPHADKALKIAVLGAAALIIIKIISWISGSFGGGSGGSGGGGFGGGKAAAKDLKKKEEIIKKFADNVNQYPQYNLSEHKGVNKGLTELMKKFSVTVNFGVSSKSAIESMDEAIFAAKMEKINTRYFREIMAHNRQPKAVEDAIKRLNTLVTELIANANKFFGDYQKDQDFPIEHYLINWSNDSIVKELAKHVGAEFIETNPRASGTALSSKWKDYVNVVDKDNLPKKDDILKTTIDFQGDLFETVNEANIADTQKLTDKFEKIQKGSEKQVIEKRKTEVRKVLTGLTNDWYMFVALSQVVLYSRSKSVKFANELGRAVFQMSETRNWIQRGFVGGKAGDDFEDDVPEDEPKK